ncbi:uncharacterized protein LOC116174820 isoform X2 [Photinus pyralis]|uniref:uncharacterized protein LOC116174820 isoform X2 n=1 Tax=Photinus pyralis TaxID=7054 RepID=UPI0012677208|nr:uncharacterized protein LOC116174820 isoform X2 [Photinus pyralis]
MSTFVDKPLSLIEKKKQQWAREKELAGLALPWNCTFKSIDEDSRTRNIRKVDSAATNAFIRRESISSRRQSLPPITDKTGTHNFSSNEKFEKEMGGETSGYGSDSANHVPEYLQASWNQNLGYESSSSARDDRAKWGDRGVGIGRFWDPHEIKYSPEMRDAPGWVKRGLQGDTELVVSNSSPAESPEQDYGEQRPYTSSSVSQTRTYIRGQNNPVDPIELAEREKRRQLAKAHQEAIKQQLEEREARRQLERERRIIEEREEELRIERDKEIERKRREYENQIILEKHERERKRKEALEEAIHIAEKEAQEQKRKQKMLRQLDLNISENVIEKEKVPSRPISNYNSHKAQNNLVDIKEDPALEESTRVHNDTQMNNAKSPPLKETNINRTQQGPPIEQVSPTHTITQPPSTQDNVTMVLQTPFEGYSMPFAILMPTFTPGPITPLPVATSVQTTETPRPRTENRTLTPSLYRNKNLCDSSTQTDYPSKLPSDQTKEIKYIREKLVNLDVSYDKQPKEDRNKNSERQRESHTDRPKWGANRPPTRYLKQSEKDPFYHRKKVRQKIRQVKIYDDKNNNYSPHSSDDSQTGSPRSYRTKGYIEKRRTRALWQKNGQMFSRNFRVYQTEIVPLESDKDHIYYKKSDCIKCCCNCRSQKHKYGDEIKMVDILKIEDSPREVGNDSCLPDCPSSIIDNEVLEKLNSLHNGLIMKQELWQHSPRTTSYSSPSRTNEIS